MDLIFNRVISDSKPYTVERQKTGVYIRKDIEELVRDEDGSVYYAYQEATLSHDEYSEYSESSRIKDSTNITTLLTGQENADNNQLIIMEAIADLYEAVMNITLGGSDNG